MVPMLLVQEQQRRLVSAKREVRQDSFLRQEPTDLAAFAGKDSLPRVLRESESKPALSRQRRRCFAAGRQMPARARQHSKRPLRKGPSGAMLQTGREARGA